MRLFKYSKKDWHYILVGTIFLVLGAIGKNFPFFIQHNSLEQVNLFIKFVKMANKVKITMPNFAK